MKKFFAVLMLVMSAQSFAYLPTIKNWKSDFILPKKVAAELIYDYYIQYVWWEDEGYECGGEFTLGDLTKKQGESYIVEGYVTMAMDYCAYETDAFYRIEIKKINGQYKVKELAFDVIE